MANPLAALKSLPCPAGEKCTAFQCLFNHDQEIKGTDSSKVEQLSLVKNPNSSTAGQDSPRKRIKLSPATPALTPSTTHQDVSTNGESKKTEVDKQESVAPLPFTHKPQLSAEQTKPTDTSSPATQTSLATMTTTAPKPAKQPSTLSASIKSSPKPTPKSSPRPSLNRVPQPEALNPRLLKKSPAQHDSRFKLVKALHEQYTRLNTELSMIAKGGERKLLLSDQELITKTLDDEQEIATRKAAIYNNAIRNRIMTYKRMGVSQWKDERTSIIKALEPQETKNEHEPIVTGLTVAQEVDFLHRFVRPLAGLERYGYVSTAPSDDDIQAAREAVEASRNTEVCDRCTRRFQVFPGRREEDGALASNGSCTYHPGKMYFPERSALDKISPAKKYRCCHQSVEDESSAGCQKAPTHVFKTTDPKRLAAILNFAETPPNPDVPADRAVCFDCEMGYTVHGLELIRITAVAWPNGEELLDILVQPIGEYMDLNTRYSGVRPEDMATAEIWKPGDDHRPALIEPSKPSEPPKRKLKVAPSPKVARDLLFSLLSPDTPLIGHGLENDLNAARIIHPTCIDTVLLYPHRRGLPVRNGLKMLMETKLGRKIQVESDEDNPVGHDSAEDAKAAGELVRLCVREEWKTMRSMGWTLDNDKPTPPKGPMVGGSTTKSAS